MKIVFFNVNDLTIDKDGLVRYLKENVSNTDIFCIQEAFENFEILEDNLFKSYTKVSSYKYVSEPDFFRQVTLIREGVRLIATNPLLEKFPLLGHGIFTQLSIGGKELGLINMHGLSRPVNKLDCSERIQQTKELIKFATKLKTPVIIGGDFNYLNNTESVKIFEDSGYVNLINKFNITNTRNEVVWRKFPNNKMYFSDWIFTSPEIIIESLEVPYNEYSDHLPLELTIRI